MNSKCLFKSKNVILRKFIAGSLAATFGAGAFSNYCAAAEQLVINEPIKQPNKDNVVEKIEAKDLISKNEGNEVFGYDENKDKNLLENINNNLKDLLSRFPGTVKDLIVNTFFSNEKCENRDFLYEHFQNFFVKNFGKKLTKEDVIFAVCKYSGSPSLALKTGEKGLISVSLKSIFGFSLKKLFISEPKDNDLKITGVKIEENGKIRVKKIITDENSNMKFGKIVDLAQKELPKKSTIIDAALVLTVLVVVVLAIIFSTVKDSNKYEKSKDEKGGSKSGSSQNQGDNANIQKIVDSEQKSDGKSSDPKVKGASLATEIAKRCAITILGSASGPLVAEVCSSVQKNGSPKSEVKKEDNTNAQT